MAEEAEQELEEGGGGGGGLVKTLAMVVPALLLGLVGGYFLGSSLTEDANQEQAQVDPAAETVNQDPSQMLGEVVTLEDFVVNLRGGSRFLKAQVQLELEKGPELLSEEVNQRKPQLRNLILELLGSKTIGELQAREGKQQLREELLARINQLLVNGRITRVFFTEFVIQ